MGKHRTRQSNRTECCPVCDMQLKNRAAAASHYRAHARRDELQQRGTTGEGAMVWKRPGDSWWFNYGYRYDYLDTAGIAKRKWESMHIRRMIKGPAMYQD